MAEYIDRKAFLDAKREQYCCDCDRRKGMKNGKYLILYDIGDVPCRACGIEDVLSDVEDFPSADVQPVRHGKWELAEDGWYCTACELYPPFDCDPEEKGIPYCPHCGAKMRGEDNG